jgi:hypothetical protein
LFPALAQVNANYAIPVYRADGSLMKFPWVGGLNNPQYSNVDLNHDGILDLFVFDRTGDRIYTFLGNGSAGEVDFSYAPGYESGFPSLISWAIITDFNCDGIGDIFTYSSGRITNPNGVGIRVYTGYYDANNQIQFEIFDSTLTYPIDGDPTNLFVSSVDIPAIADVNGDGDMDVLAFQSTGGYVQYFENISKESGFGCDSLIMKKQDNCWGDFFEPALQRASWLDQECPLLQEQAEQRLHAGSTQLVWDNNGDGAVESLKGDLSWDNLVFQFNDGTPANAHIFEEDTLFPSYDVPAAVFTFPAPFLADVNHDGLRDLLVAPNASGGTENYQCSWYYQNTGDTVTAVFDFVTETFLVEDLIDAGEGAFPVFFDVNQDGLLDLVLGNRGYFDDDNINIFSGQLAYFENTGTAESPQFKLVTLDFAAVKSLKVKSVVPTFGDLDGDLDFDMLLGQEDGTLLFFKNIGLPGEEVNLVFFGPNYAGIDVGNSSATPQLIDVDRDGLIDLLIGEQDGNLNYYRNEGTAAIPSFVKTNEFFGEVDVRAGTSITGFSAPFLFDENDGQGYQLMVGSQRGTVYHYANIDGNLSGAFTLLDSVYAGIEEGDRATISGGDVNGDGLMDWLVGNYRGGIRFYDSEYTTIEQPADAAEAGIRVVPNPAREYIEVAAGGNLNLASFQYRVKDVAGREVLAGRLTEKTNRIGVSQLPAGIYFLLLSRDQYRIVNKIVVTD